MMTKTMRDYIMLIENQSIQEYSEQYQKFKNTIGLGMMEGPIRQFMRNSKLNFSTNLLTRIVDQTEDNWGEDHSFFENAGIIMEPYLITIQNALEENGMAGQDIDTDENGSPNPLSLLKYLNKMVNVEFMSDRYKRSLEYCIPVLLVLVQLASKKITWERIVELYGSTTQGPFKH